MEFILNDMVHIINPDPDQTTRVKSNEWFTLEVLGYPDYAINLYFAILNLQTNRISILTPPRYMFDLKKRDVNNQLKRSGNSYLTLLAAVSEKFKNRELPIIPVYGSRVMDMQELDRTPISDRCDLELVGIPLYDPSIPYVITKSSGVWNSRTKHKLKVIEDVDGYLGVTLHFPNGDGRRMGIHRLLALAFLPRPIELLEQGYSLFSNDGTTKGMLVVNHKDGNKRNNDISNLEWLTSKENTRHAINIKLINDGRKVIDDEVIHKICELLELKYSNTRIVKELAEYGVTASTVGHIRKKRQHRDISDMYDYPDDSPKLVSDEQVHSLCSLICEGMSVPEAATEMDINVSTAYSIYNGESRTDITSQYDLTGATQIGYRLPHPELYNGQPIETKQEKMMYQIYTRIDAGMSDDDIAKEVGLHVATVRDYRSSSRYCNVRAKYGLPPIKRGTGVWDISTVKKIKTMLHHGSTAREVSDKLGIPLTTVRSIQRGETHADVAIVVRNPSRSEPQMKRIDNSMF